jgi:hypothetical protein
MSALVFPEKQSLSHLHKAADEAISKYRDEVKELKNLLNNTQTVLEELNSCLSIIDTNKSILFFNTRNRFLTALHKKMPDYGIAALEELSAALSQGSATPEKK